MNAMLGALWVIPTPNIVQRVTLLSWCQAGPHRFSSPEQTERSSGSGSFSRLVPRDCPAVNSPITAVSL